MLYSCSLQKIFIHRYERFLFIMETVVMLNVIVLSFQTPACRHNISEPYEDRVLDQQRSAKDSPADFRGAMIILSADLLRLKSFLSCPNQTVPQCCSVPTRSFLTGRVGLRQK